MSLAIEPLTLVDVSIGILHAALSIHVFVLDVSGVKRTVLVLDVAQAFPDGLVVLVKFTLVLAFVIDLRPVVVPHEIFAVVFGCHVSLPLFLGHKRVV